MRIDRLDKARDIDAAVWDRWWDGDSPLRCIGPLTMLIPDMTLLLAMEGKDGLLIAADKRVSLSGGAYSDNAKKIIRIYKNCCAAYCGDDGCLARPVLDDAIHGCHASPQEAGDADQFSNRLSELGRQRFVVNRAQGERQYSFGFLVVGYADSGTRPVLRVLNNELGLLPCSDPTGWVWFSGRRDIIPHYNNLLGERTTDILVSTLPIIATLILRDTGAMCMSVSQAVEMFIVRPDSVEPIATDVLARDAEKIRRAMSSTLRRKLGLPKL